jgi:predicted transcriptional regulator
VQHINRLKKERKLSRGLGHIQREIVAKLTIYGKLDVRRTALLIFHKKYEYNRHKMEELTLTQINTVHRAMRALAKQGIVKLSKEISNDGYPCWMLARPVIDWERIKRAAKKRRPSLIDP